MISEHSIHADVAVIGSGIAGLGAALFAADRGLSVAIVGESGATDFCSGLIDLLGAFPGEGPRGDPWLAMSELETRFPRHPLASATAARALDRFCEVLAQRGMEYTGFRKRNALVPTQLGTVRPAYRVPATMWPGVAAFAENASCLILDIEGMMDFDAEGMVLALGDAWPAARSECLPFPDPGRGGEARPMLLARSLEGERSRRELAGSISRRLKPGEAVGMPAILGVHSPDRARSTLQEMIGATVFEIPVLPNPVPGARIREALRGFFSQGEAVRFLTPGRVLRATVCGERDFMLEVGTEEPERFLRASSVVLASGRFLARGLQGDRTGIREPLFRLPVAQPETRQGWHRPDLFDPRGHGVDSAGIETDAMSRPVDGQGRPVAEGLFAAGSILAHADWTRFKCGAGLCLASAWRAAEGVVSVTRPRSGKKGARSE
jgi:glycerol-3-phosphate dehydrogenase subunit B